MTETILRTDREWSVTDGAPCRVIAFTPSATIHNGKVVTHNRTEPYASVILECKKFPQTTTGCITHRTDFQHLWNAFRKRGVAENEEVIIFWSNKHLKTYAKLLSAFMPRLWVMI